MRSGWKHRTISLSNHLKRTWLTLSLLLGGAGCHQVQTAVEMPGQAVRAVTPGKTKEKPGTDLVALQQNLLRFTDEFWAGTVIALDKLEESTNVLSSAEVLKIKIWVGTEVCSIASGPNALANLLDMTVFVTSARQVAENRWKSEVYGEAVLPLVESCRQCESNIWQMASTVLKTNQVQELKKAIADWRARNPNQGVMGARAVGFAAQFAQTHSAEASSPGSVFSLLRLDPLSSLDPAAREVAQTRLFAERALYVTQKMPSLLRWQVELMTLNTLQAPQVQQLVTNTTTATESLQHLTLTAEKLPQQLSTEREELVKALEAQEKTLTPLLAQVNQALVAGSQMSTSLNTTLTTFDTVMGHLSPPQTNPVGPPRTNSQPFRIQDYTLAAAQLEATARQLTELLVALDKTVGPTNLATVSAQANSLIQQTQTSGRALIDHGFWLAVLLVAVILVAALAYAHFKPSRPASPTANQIPNGHE
jgi:hypothetical protein